MKRDSKYLMWWGGDWRAVTNMFDHANRPTTCAMRAAKVVLFISEDNWAATAVTPGDLVERGGRDPNARDWDFVDR
jgi:hypothetical protein